MQIGDAIVAAEAIEVNNRKRDEANKAVSHRLDMGDMQEGCPPSNERPLRLGDVDRISALFGDRNQPDVILRAEAFGLKMWPRFEKTRSEPQIWELCLQQSPTLLTRFRLADRQEVLKWHNVGLLLEEDIDCGDKLQPAQALVLGYLRSAGFNHLSSDMLLAKITELHAAVPRDCRAITKYSKAFTTSIQHQMEHGETVALLDFQPWGDCDESALVNEYLSTVPKPKKKTRKVCPISASNLFNTGGPEITGAVNMRLIADFEEKKAAEVAEKAERKKQRTHKKVRKREDATTEVANMVIQEMLQAKTPPEQVLVFFHIIACHHTLISHTYTHMHSSSMNRDSP